MELSVISGCQYYADPCLFSGYVPLLSECGLISPCTAGYRAYMCHLLMIQNSIKRRRACASKVHKIQGVFFFVFWVSCWNIPFVPSPTSGPLILPVLGKI